MPRERIPTDQPVRQLWARFGVLESVSGASQFLTRRAADEDASLSSAQIEAKAQGLAFAVRSAREYFAVPIEGNLTNACLALYYGMMSLFQALLMADVKNSLTLPDMERYTTQGHGLRALHVSDLSFPESERVMILRDGFLPRYLRAYEYPVESTRSRLVVPTRPSTKPL
jgi:YaaC-like protein